MKWGTYVGAALVVLSGATILAAWSVSIEVQRINPYDDIRRELTGQIGTEEGAPIRAVILRRSVLIEREGNIPAIDPEQHYPLQLRTVVYMGVWVAVAGAVVLICGFAGRRFVRP
ncbi:MAG: hypothetical protein JSU68_14750 [Phycisphaerales bacterium]|nr:MAG: hypothetical protein JSU68_14750 [Phycisphaerales bacterium]